MARLQTTGPISLNDLNTNRNIPSGTQIDLDTAAIAYGIPAKPHGMDEFYGKGQGAPSPSPNVTPSVTPSPNVTPSVTPSPNVTPAYVAPSVTPNVTPTYYAPNVTPFYNNPPTFNVSKDCNAGTTSTSGKITIGNINYGGGNCYVGYSTNSGNPGMYADTGIGSATEYTFYNVPDYGGSYIAYVYNPDTGLGAYQNVGSMACYVAPAVTPAVPSPTPAPVYYIALSSGATACEAKGNFQGPQN
jgi:hypothetical protein